MNLTELGFTQGYTRNQLRRIAWLSRTELLVSFIAFFAAFVGYVDFDFLFTFTPLRTAAIQPHNTLSIATTGVWVILNVFLFILDRQTLLVSFVLKRLSPLPLENSAADEWDESLKAKAALRAVNTALHATQEAIVKEESRNDPQSKSDLKESIKEIRERLSEVNIDAVDVEFRNYLVRSGAAAATAQRRPNALLFIGAIIAILGLIFFIVTLPGSRFSIISAAQTAQSASTGEQSASHEFIQLIPRLLMLVFIQVLAGFFLKQYRASMEDFRYFESVLRYREAQYLSYVLRKQTDDRKAIAAFSKEIIEDRQLFGMLARGQTTMMLEAQRMERNEFASFYEVLAELAIAAKNKATGTQREAHPRKKGETSYD